MCSSNRQRTANSNSTEHSSAEKPTTSSTMVAEQQLEQQTPCSPSTSYSTHSSGSSSPSTSQLAASYPLILREQLELQEQLGAGTYGSVFKGRWQRPEGGEPLTVALKKVFMLEKEVEILSQIRHRNIIQFYGVSRANPDFWIVTEYAEKGSLFDQLHNVNEPMSCDRIIKWAIQIARGVAYLHHEAPLTVIHRDLKSKNIVIGRKGQCKLCDFGTSKDLTHSWTAPSWGGTAAWMSPEIISQHEGISIATDVWSYAVVLWEMFAREIPYNGLTEFKIYSIISQHGVRLVIPDTCPAPLAELLQSCWRTDPKERPDMRMVLATLEHMNTDKELQRECAQFLSVGREEWRERIREQLSELESLKLDLARQMEDLRRREQALRKRENSHRNFLHMVDTLNVEDVGEWNEDCVCEWVQNVAAAAATDFSEDTVDKLISSVFQYEITGARLLRITEKDLESLGVEPVAVRRYIGRKLDELRAMNVHLCNFGEQEGSTRMQEQPDDAPTPMEKCILLHAGLYSRMVSLPSGPAFRFKVFVDSDWEKSSSSVDAGTNEGDDSPDSSFLIKEVTISITAADHSTVLEPVQCICPPFGYLQWAEVDKRKLPLTVIIGVKYTDQVVQPRNTRIQIQLDSLANGPRTLCNKRVALRVSRRSSDCLSRISSQMLQIASLPPSAVQQRYRRWSNGVSGSVSPDVGRSSSNLLNRSPIWADLAHCIRNPASCSIRPVSKSISLEHRPTTSTDVEEQELDPVQRARQLALAKVRRQRTQRKKCVSETDNAEGRDRFSRPQRQQHHVADFYLSQPSSSQSTSPASNKGGTEADSDSTTSDEKKSESETEKGRKMSATTGPAKRCPPHLTPLLVRGKTPPLTTGGERTQDQQRAKARQ